jgi:hypothetical protein
MTTSARKARHVRHPAGTEEVLRPASQDPTQRDPAEAARAAEEEERQVVLVPRRSNVEQPESEESEAALDGLPVFDDGVESSADDPCTDPRRGRGMS